MASPQLEDGHLRVAFSLYAAIVQARFSGLEHDVLGAIMLLTYGRNCTMARITVDDIRSLLGKRSNTRRVNVERALKSLIDKNVVKYTGVNQHIQELGIQKDYEEWVGTENEFAKSSSQVKVISNNLINLSTDAKVANPISQLMDYIETLRGYTFDVKVRAMEAKRMDALYSRLLSLTRSPEDTQFLLRDLAYYCLPDDAAKLKIRMPVAYMAKVFDPWYRAMPKKMPWEIKDNQQMLSERMRYNLHTRNWERTGEKLERS